MRYKLGNQVGHKFIKDMVDDNNYVYNYYVDDTFLYHPVDLPDIVRGYRDQPQTKIRTVYAGMGHYSLAGAMLLYPLQNEMMSRLTGKHASLRLNWSHPLTMYETVGRIVELLRTEEGSDVSADDKSGFDNFFPPILSHAFFKYIIANKFPRVDRALLRQLALPTQITSL